MPAGSHLNPFSVNSSSSPCSFPARPAEGGLGENPLSPGLGRRVGRASGSCRPRSGLAVFSPQKPRRGDARWVAAMGGRQDARPTDGTVAIPSPSGGSGAGWLLSPLPAVYSQHRVLHVVTKYLLPSHQIFPPRIFGIFWLLFPPSPPPPPHPSILISAA